MANLRKWSTTATGNATVAGGASTINFAEGQLPSTLNNSAREMMAQIRGVYKPSEWGWVECSATASVASQTTFKLTGDQTGDYTAGRRWRIKSASTTRYGSIVSSSYTTETTVTVTVDSGSLSASHSLAAVAAIDSNHIPTNTYLTSASAVTALALKQNSILFQDEGVALSATGAATTVNFVGTGFSASLTSGVLTLTSVAVATGVAVVRTQVFTASGTYTPNANMLYCKVIATGCGGGGGGVDVVTTTTHIAAGGGGGAGGTAIKVFSAATIGASQAVTIGSAGTAGGNTGTNGGTGGNTTFGALLTGSGGAGGTGHNSGSAVSSKAGGAGGTASSGDINITGGDGGAGWGFTDATNVMGGGGNGGASYWGGGGRGGALAAGTAGAVYGSGGGGASISNSAGAAGGAGAGGVVYIEEYCSA